MKKSLALMLVLALSLSLGLPAAATYVAEDAEITCRGIKITVNGQVITPVDANGAPVEPFILNGSTYLPVRAVANALGLNVEWIEDINTIVLSTGGAVNQGGGMPAASYKTKTATITYRNIKISLGGQKLETTDVHGTPVEGFIYDGSTYLPLRAVAGALGLAVDWDEATSTVSLTGVVSAEATVKLLSRTAGSDAVTTYSYDEQGRLISMETTNADGTVVSETVAYTYDVYGNRLTADSAKYGADPYAISVTYDADGHTLTRHSGTAEMGSDVVYTYDERGNLLMEVSTGYAPEGMISGNDFSRVYDYDDGGNLVLVTQTDGGGTWTTAYTYDANGNCLTESSGTTVTTYAYDEAGNLLSRVTTSEGAVLSSDRYTYDAAGRVLTADDTSMILGSLRRAYTYDAEGKLLTSEWQGGKAAAGKIAYTYDANGRLLAEQYLDGSDVVTSENRWFYDTDGDTLRYEVWTGGEAPAHYTDYEYVTATVTR